MPARRADGRRSDSSATPSETGQANTQAAGAGADVGLGVDVDVDAVLDACRSLVAISAWSVEAVANEVDLVQLRILVVLATRGASSLKDLAEVTRLHLTRASRACDRLVGKKLISRSDDPADRRVLQLRLTPRGEAVVGEVMQARREAVAPVLAAMSARRRTELVRSLRAFAEAGGEVGHGDVSALAWTP